ncbi:hypothetical protein [Ramlibacter sp. WS9]|uniref:hypothetical protein n=1 Tax=Ramlibacter sp. WS9 TaxID=1882741 RepID=UPI00114388AC|nr:hypothetical protein [Ramlibacter sp. WS9]ROZ79200.1 hypothetical protein EEB15_05905 [Ramlibacter sp. WS9]
MMLQWVSVTTVHAPAWLIRLHAAYMKLLGAELCVYFVDRPASYTEAELSELSQHAKLFLCDDDFWRSFGGRPENIADRQLSNVGFARSQVDAKWFLHIDIDEFPHVALDIGRMLDGAPSEVSEFHFQNVERLILRGGAHWHDGLLRLPNFDMKLQSRHYGQRTRFLGAGLSSYFHGKSLVKNAPRVMQGVHTSMHVLAHWELVRMTIPLHEGFLVHYPCICLQHLVFRLRRNKFRDPGVRKFRHEHRLDEFMFGPDARPENIDSAAGALHTCTPEQASTWSEVGLCRSIPAAYLERFEQAAGGADVLKMDFAERSLAEFYRD